MTDETREQLWKDPDWTCPHCNTVNLAIREKCRNCGYDSNCGEFPWYNPLPPYDGLPKVGAEQRESDKVRELAERQTINVYPGLSDQYPEFRKLRDENERILREGLKPLLTAVEDITRQANPSGTRRIDASIKVLAAELQGWRKE